MILLVILSVFPLFNLLTAVYNLFTSKELKENSQCTTAGLVSVLIPARNEELNIRECLTSVVNQSYRNLEIIVLDDMSDDNTYGIAKKISDKDSRVKIIRGAELLPGWLGKNNACDQLFRASAGDLMLYIDADVRLERNAVESAVCELVKEDADMLTIYPVQMMRTFGERLGVSILNWIIFSFLPVNKVGSSDNPAISAGVGQFMLWRRNAYVSAGGHEAVKSEIVEDIELAKIAKQKGSKIVMLTGGKLVFCRMYRSLKESISGFTKNFYPASKSGILIYLAGLFYICASYLLPLILIFWRQEFIFLLMVIIIERIVISILSKQSVILDVLTYPLQMMLMLLIGIKSLIAFKTKKAVWKKRQI